MTMPSRHILKYLLLLYFIDHLLWLPSGFWQNMATSGRILDQIVEVVRSHIICPMALGFGTLFAGVGPAAQHWQARTMRKALHEYRVRQARHRHMNGVFMNNIKKIKDVNFCDLMCAYARLPGESALDGSGSCRTFIALYCDLKKSIVAKNMPCSRKKVRTKPRV